MGEEQELRLAIVLAGVLNGEDHSSILHLDQEDGGSDFCQSCLYAKLAGLTAELAMSRAEETGRDFDVVHLETQYSIQVKAGKFLEKTVHPALRVLTKVVIDVDIDQEDGEINVCGICQGGMKREDDVRALDCKHSFHCECIFKWLKKKMVCPFCRFSPVVQGYKKTIF